MANKVLEIDGHKIKCAFEGSASNPPMILLHGFSSHRGVWTKTADALKDDFYGIGYDQLRFGGSDKPKEEDDTIAVQAERALQAADHFSLDNLILAGHSMGGQKAATSRRHRGA